MIVRWTALGGATVAAGWVLDRAGRPSPYLFAALLLGLVVALALARAAAAVPPPAFTVAQAITGVVLGAYLKSSSLEALADAWLPVVLVSAGTLGALPGRRRRRCTHDRRSTARPPRSGWSPAARRASSR